MQKLYEFDTVLSADSVEFCPNNKPWLALGTYQNDESTRKRIGQVSLLDVSSDALTILDKYDCSGILDMKWLHLTHNDSLSIVTSTGELSILAVVDNTFQIVSSAQNDPSNLLLSLDWSNRKSGSLACQCITSSSNGKLLLYDLAQDLSLVSEISAHSFEAWISAFDYWNPSIVYSGGDDCLFKGWDIKSGKNIFVNKNYSAGVTSIASHPLKEFIVACGSYDESLCLWDSRNFNKPLSRLEMGGGLWRTKWHPYDPNLLITACMYNGFHILSTDDNHSLTLKESYMAHSSIAYGVDWQLNRDAHVFASCSFYDHLLHVVNVYL